MSHDRVETPSLRERHASGLLLERRRIRSEYFAWEHEIRIALPPRYDATDVNYPVLWITDGSFAFDFAIQAYLAVRHLVPEMILVGVGAPPEDSADVHRRRVLEFSAPGPFAFDGFGGELYTREFAAMEHRLAADGVPPSDATGGADAFLNFLVDVLRPALGRDYRMEDEHALFGGSAGGRFCAHALLTRPAAFTRYICGSPALNSGDYEVFRLEEAYARDHQDLRAKIFFGAGEAEILQGGPVSAVGCVSSMVRLAEILRVRAYPSLELHVRIFPGEDHTSVIPTYLTWGLRTLWSDGSNT
jgi:predicted alpha/beta superfamily hydrolase